MTLIALAAVGRPGYQHQWVPVSSGDFAFLLLRVFRPPLLVDASVVVSMRGVFSGAGVAVLEGWAIFET